jgi:hypothetical protein
MMVLFLIVKHARVHVQHVLRQLQHVLLVLQAHIFKDLHVQVIYYHFYNLDCNI